MAKALQRTQKRFTLFFRFDFSSLTIVRIATPSIIRTLLIVFILLQPSQREIVQKELLSNDEPVGISRHHLLAEALPLKTHLINELISLVSIDAQSDHSVTVTSTSSSSPSLQLKSKENLNNKSPNLTNVIEQILSIRSLNKVNDSIGSKNLDLNDPILIDYDIDLDSNLTKTKIALEIFYRAAVFIYCCLVIGYLCDQYFVPSLEDIGLALNLRSDLIGAILIPFGTSGPEIFSSAIGVFFAENDIGTGAIIGSSVFNLLAIPAASGLATIYFIGKPIRLDKGPILRDLTCYLVTIIVLILAIKDNTVDLIDSILFTILFVLYVAVMFYNVNEDREQSGQKSVSMETATETDLLLKNSGPNIDSENSGDEISLHYEERCQYQQALSPSPIDDPSIITYQNYYLPQAIWSNIFKTTAPNYHQLDESGEDGMKRMMGDNSIADLIRNSFRTREKFNKFENQKECFVEKISEYYSLENSDRYDEDGLFQNQFNFREKISSDQNDDICLTDHWIIKALLMPFILIYSITMPKRFASVTFLLSIFWLSLLSYVTVWSISGLSDRLQIPSIISGMTILAAGSAVPDLVTTIIVIKKSAQVSMGICAAIASNIFAILLGLGMPWVIQFLINWTRNNSYQESAIHLKSNALPYTSMLLLAMVIFLYLIFRCCEWKLSRRFSLICVIVHLIFISVSIALELYAGPLQHHQAI
ncbi:Sodium/potassium/calcium exchanger 2 [Sarcoptes scabiei]|nr:Sodium/potassium/calcium exchanger 2 [Sarcoptes scabiei]